MSQRILSIELASSCSISKLKIVDLIYIYDYSHFLKILFILKIFI